MALRSDDPEPSPDSAADTIAAEWQARGIDPATLAMRHGTVVSTRRDAHEPNPTGALLPLLSPGDGASPEFSILGVLGEGGMGVVRLARQSSLCREVALKSVKDDVDAPEGANALIREARVIGALEHPNVVPVHALGRDDKGRPVLAMKRIEGRSWADVLDAADRASDGYLERQLDILRQVAMAIAFAHDRRVLHRDVKPENVMIGAYGEVYLVDWGIAVNLSEGGVRGLRLARDIREIEGTPCYMAPEMAAGSGPDIDERSDVYLLGATLHQVLTGEPPHLAPTLTGTLSRAFESRPHDYGPTVPRALASICHRAMAQHGEDRYPSASAFAEALRDYLVHRESMRLAEEAQQRLGQLEALLGAHDAVIDEAAIAAAQSLFAEVRFAFQQALRSWQTNDAARAGLHRALERMIAFELDRGAPEAAAAYLRELPEPPAPLAARVRSALAEREQRQERLSQLERDLDLSIGERERRILMLGFSAAWGAAHLGASLAARRGMIRVDLRSIEVGVALLFAISVAVGRLAFPSLGVTQANRAQIRLAAVIFLAVAALFGLGLHFDVSLAACAAAAAVVAGAQWTALAVTADRNWYVMTGANAVAVVGCLAAPRYAFEILGVAGCAGGLVAARRWLSDARVARS